MHSSQTVLGQLPPRKLPHNPKTNPKSNPNPNRGAIFLGGIVWLTPNPKTNPDLDSHSNPNRGGQLSGYPRKRRLFGQTTKQPLNNFKPEKPGK